MAERFEVNNFFDVLVRTPVYKTTKFIDFALIKKDKQYKKRLWYSFYFALFSGCIFTAIFIEQTNIAYNIMETARAARRGERAQTAQTSDLSSISITTSPGSFALITNPEGMLAGETIDNIRYTELSTADITDQRNLAVGSSANWSMLIDSPVSGEYTLELAANQEGEYTASIISYDRHGNRFVHTNTYTLNNQKPQQAIFLYDKSNVANSSVNLSQQIY